MFQQPNQRASWRNDQNEKGHKTLLGGSETLPSSSQPVGANSVTLAEITHFSLGHAPTGHLKCFLESPGISQVYLWTCLLHLSATAALCLLPDVPSPTAAEFLNPRDIASAQWCLSLCLMLCCKCQSSAAHALVSWRNILVGVYVQHTCSPRDSNVFYEIQGLRTWTQTGITNTSKSSQPHPLGSGWFKTSPWFCLPLGGFLSQELP